MATGPEQRAVSCYPVVVVCPSCGNGVPAPGDARVTRCGRCRAVVPVPASSAGSVSSDRDDPRVDERWESGAFRVRLSPQRWGAAPLVFFAVVWNLFLFGWYRVALLAPGPFGVALWFPVLHVAVGLWVVYEALSVLFNHTYVLLTRHGLDAGHAPLPRLGDVHRPTNGLDGFDAAPRERAFGASFGLDAFSPMRWTVAARRSDGGHQPLPLSLPTERAARRLAARLDEALHTLRTPSGYRG